MSKRPPHPRRRHDRLSHRDQQRKSMRKAQRKSQRTLHHETLERRELLAAAILHSSFVPGTTQEQIDQFNQNQSGGNGAQGGNVGNSQSRWANTASGVSPNLGDSSTVTWSIIPDGTDVNGLPAGTTSDLVAFLDGIYGQGGNTTIDTRPWFGLFQRVFDSWEDISGINFEYEAADDGIGQGGGPGVLGTRGDIRIGGADDSGNPMRLAYAYGPDFGAANPLSGEIVVDTTNGFYATNADGATGANLGFHNTIAHEVGHAIGLGHVVPDVSGVALMTPTISLAFRGPQHDDILGVHTLYGDRFIDNDVQANAAPVGTLDAAGIVVDNVSIDQDNDQDWYSFDATAGQLLSLSIRPNGEIYDIAADGDPPITVDSTRYSDLRFEVYDPGGALVTSQAANLL
ncbi:MAG: matrixin family metalloprotease, partial [Pirellulaceae bacterium]|nr:matrixin family metalloprotease [Pirellulaceae bacterium]